MIIPRKYRKRPAVIEAVQWDGTIDVLDILCEWQGARRVVMDSSHVFVTIETLEGMMRANKGDYIIKGVQGEIYPCKPDIFEQTYEAL